MTWWCMLFHSDWWYVARVSEHDGYARIVCSKCKAPMVVWRKPAVLRALDARLEKP